MGHVLWKIWQLPWEGHFRNYRQQDGFLVPMEGDVGWYIDDEWRAVGRAPLSTTQYGCVIDTSF